MLIYHSFCLCMHLGSCWTQVFWDGNDHMADTLKINSTCPASRAHHILLMVLFFFFFQCWTMETEQLPLWESGSLQRQSMTDAVCYQQSLDTLQRQWFHGPTSFSGYLTKNPNKKNQLCYCFRCCERAHKKWAAAAPEPCWWALSWALGMCCARDDSSSCTHQVLCVLLIHHKTDKIWWLRKMWANKTG